MCKDVPMEASRKGIFSSMLFRVVATPRFTLVENEKVSPKQIATRNSVFESETFTEDPDQKQRRTRTICSVFGSVR